MKLSGLAISRTIADLVLDRREAILSRDATAEFATCDSVQGQGLRSLMCAPLLDSEHRPLGIIQLDAGARRGEFSRADLDLLGAVSGPIGLAVENARLHQRAIHEAGFEQELACAGEQCGSEEDEHMRFERGMLGGAENVCGRAAPHKMLHELEEFGQQSRADAGGNTGEQDGKPEMRGARMTQG